MVRHTLDMWVSLPSLSFPCRNHHGLKRSLGSLFWAKTTTIIAAATTTAICRHCHCYQHNPSTLHTHHTYIPLLPPHTHTPYKYHTLTEQTPTAHTYYPSTHTPPLTHTPHTHIHNHTYTYYPQHTPSHSTHTTHILHTQHTYTTTTTTI